MLLEGGIFMLPERAFGVISMFIVSP